MEGEQVKERKRGDIVNARGVAERKREVSDYERGVRVEEMALTREKHTKGS